MTTEFGLEDGIKTNPEFSRDGKKDRALL